MYTFTAFQTAIALGYVNEHPECNYTATFWNVPNGYDVVNASVVKVWFEDKESRDIFVRTHKDDESMAFAE